MGRLLISEVARQAGVRASAIRYYEKMRILAPAQRVSGQRRYDVSAVYRLAAVRCAQEAGFTLDEIRRLLPGTGTRMSERWAGFAGAKTAELEERIRGLQRMKDLLGRLKTRCRCETVEECGKRLLAESGRRALNK